MLLHELPETVAGRRRPGQHHFTAQVALNVFGEARWCTVTAVAVLLQRLHHDPVEFSLQKAAELDRLDPALGSNGGRCDGAAEARARPWRVLVLDQAEHLLPGRLLEA